MAGVKAVYVLVAEQVDIYVLCSYLSVALLRRIHPDAQICLLCDTTTRELLEKSDVPLLSEVQEVLVCDLDEPRPVVRSRYLKSHMRNLVEGDFVYLDADALPVRPISQVWNQDFTIAAVLDRNFGHPYPHFPDWVAQLYARYGWSPAVHYCNAGVVFWRDNPEGRRVGEVCAERWQTYFQKEGQYRDQPAFNSALQTVQPALKILGVEYNGMVEASPWYGRKANILHFYVSDHQPNEKILLGYLLEYWRKHREIDWKTLDRTLARDSFWVKPSDNLQHLLACHDYAPALGHVLSKLSNPRLWWDYFKHGLLKRRRPR